MTSPAAVDPTPPQACSACGGQLDSLGRCAKCGAVFGKAYRCPLCDAVSELEPSPDLFLRCRVCGGPRISPSAGPSPEREVALLRAARSEQLRAGAYRAGAGFALASGLLSVVVTNVVLLATSPAAFARVFALLASVVPLLLSFLAFRRAGAHRKQLQQSLQQAWLSAAGRVSAQAGGQIDAASLAQTLRTDEARAELLLAELSVQEFVEPHAPPAKVRVTDLADPNELLAAAEQSKAQASSKP